MDVTYSLTEKGLEKLTDELDYLQTIKQKDVEARVKRARSFCNFSSDPTYSSAVEELTRVTERINTIEHMLQHARTIEKSTSEVVTLGSFVRITNIPKGESVVYQLVNRVESDPSEGKITLQSPMAKALLGHRKGDEVCVQTPRGNRQVRIMDIF
ncbi:GreA/GreB family elongation factor [Virgibacillus sp. W0430]|uniref:GreA/GreB family elongation factor n=1 Tax=Virgibacillus sp. W0430 TaxID=3391580 RepID=UPI003F4795F4